MTYKKEKLTKPIWRGKRVFKWKIVRPDGSTVFLFQDEKTAEETLVRLGT